MADENSIYSYTPSFPLAIVVAILYAIPTLLLAYQTLIKYHSWFFLCVLVGSMFEVAGYGVRAASTRKTSDIPLYASSSTLIVLAPVFIAAGNYLLIGRLIRAVLPDSRHRIFFIPARLITKIFVAFDILSFLVQCSGTSIAATASWVGSQADVGTNVLIGGLGLQVVTFVWFLSIVTRFWWCTQGRTGVKAGAPPQWMRVLQAICVSSCLILIRSVYRVIEFALGIEGYPFTHEWIFYVFEALPMLPAIAVFCYVHPAKYLGSKGGLGKEAMIEESGVLMVEEPKHGHVE
ncbi:RTA1-domain-containing protein [Sporormia fimetaria CBS 119925]|uniref:RTA1-domain-containing protein n=1 Tax=Sporormia fimetaria CBS 119925 TaxID=1340428 RepID=A0A6A6UXW9_9PLEO|nr:RTA1-domain-containing protein [Sporormia fimetaria CBS 119925]